MSSIGRLFRRLFGRHRAGGSSSGSPSDLVTVEGLDNLVSTFDAVDDEVCEAAMRGLETAGMRIIADAKVNLRENLSVVTGLLRASGHVMRQGWELTIGFFDTTNRNSGYASFVEYGRRAGKMPPPDEIGAWVYKKFHLKDWKTANSLGWAIAKRIAQQGTQPHPFFEPAVDKNKSRFEKYVKKEVTRITR